MSERDLFGAEIIPERVREMPNGRKRKTTKPNGYAFRPGTGPAGETCGSCAHLCARTGGNKAYWKCGLLKAVWTCGPGTDIRCKSPACRKWQEARS